MKIEGKVAVVSGGGSGIGRAAVLAPCRISSITLRSWRFLFGA